MQQSATAVTDYHNVDAEGTTLHQSSLSTMFGHYVINVGQQIKIYLHTFQSLIYLMIYFMEKYGIILGETSYK